MTLRLLAPVLLALATSALAACARHEAAPAPLACEPLPAAEALLAAPAAKLIVIGVQAPPEARAVLLTVCAALTRGESVTALVPQGPEWGDVHAVLQAWASEGAALAIQGLPVVDPAARAEGEALLAQALAAAIGGSDRAVALVDADSAARRTLGLSGQTWSPAGALLDQRQTVTLRAMPAQGDAARLTLEPFEDVLPVGAARAYDGLITLPGPAAALAGDDLRGR